MFKRLTAVLAAAFLLTVAAYAVVDRAVPTTGTLSAMITDLNTELATLYQTIPTPLSSVSSGSTKTASATPTLTSYQDGQIFMMFYPDGSDNTGAVTLNINSLGAKSIRRQDGTVLTGGELRVDHHYLLRYASGVNTFLIINQYFARESMCWAVGDETTTITTGTAKLTFRVPYAFHLEYVTGSINTVSSSGLPTVDINDSGTTIMNIQKITIDVGEKTSRTAAAPPNLTDTELASDAEMTVDIDVAGTGAKGLKICLVGFQ